MVRTLEYTGLPSPFENLDSFVHRALKLYPQIRSQASLNRFIKQATVNRQQRYKIGKAERVMVLFGADILSDEPLSNPAWQYMRPSWTQAILNATPEVRQGMVKVEGLSRTYLWCYHNRWLQDVSDEDYDRIMQSGARNFFRDPEIHGYFVEVQSYNHLRVTERYEVPNLIEGDRLLQDRKRKHYVNGAEIRP